MKKLIPAIVLLLISAMVMSTASFAWFSMNRTVTATGMQVKAQSSSSLVIANTIAGGIGTSTSIAPVNSGSLFTLQPCTHDDNSATYSNLLKTITNSGAVDAASGTTINGTALTYENAVGGDGNNFVDYVVYIASAGSILKDAALSVVITETAGGSSDDETLKAISADFYVNENTDELGDYKGTLNIAGLDIENSRLGTTGEKTEKKTLQLFENKDIPKNGTSRNYIRVTMRVYFDGALLREAGAYAAASGTAVAGTVYYTDANGNLPTSQPEEGADVSTMYTCTKQPQCYVYSNEIAAGGLTFTATFTAN